jgi:hypothetical protein
MILKLMRGKNKIYESLLQVITDFFFLLIRQAIF